MKIKVQKYIKSAKSTSYYLLASIIPAIISLLVNPLVATNMSHEDYAIVGYYSAFNLLFVPLISFYMAHFFAKRFFEYSEEKRDELKALIYKIFLIISPVLAFLSAAGLGIYHFLRKSTIIPFLPYALIFISSLYFQSFFTLELSDLKMNRKGKLFFYFSILQSALIVLSTIVLVVHLKLGAAGKMTATLLESVILFIIVFFRNRSLLKTKIPFSQIWDALMFCAPLVLAAILSFFTKGYDAVLLERLNETNNFAHYAIATQFVAYLSLVTNAIQNTFQPDIYQAIHDNDRKKVTNLFALFVLFSTTMVVGFVIVAPVIVRILMWGRYLESIPFVRLASFSVIFSTIYYFISTVFIAKGKNHLTLINKIITSVIIIIVYPIVISKFRYAGACVLMSFSYIIQSLGYIFVNSIISRYVKISHK